MVRKAMITARYRAMYSPRSRDVRSGIITHMNMPNTHAKPTGAAWPAGGEAAIRVDGLRKAYGDRVAVRGLSFAVPPGEIFALLGPNGAGKTTTVEVLEGYRAPDAGEVRV